MVRNYIRVTTSRALGGNFRKLPFWERVAAQLQRNRECLEFTGAKDDAGYGRIFGEHGKLVRLHRAVWAKANGEIQQGKVIMHVCDNRACIELAHLKLGTQIENIKDMHTKERAKRMPYTFDVVW